MACPACVLCKNEYCKLIRTRGWGTAMGKGKGKCTRGRERLRIVLCRRLSAHKVNVARTACLIYPNRKRHRLWGRGKIGSPRSPPSSLSSSSSGCRVPQPAARSPQPYHLSLAPTCPAGGQKRAKPEKNQKQRRPPGQKETDEQVEQYALRFFCRFSAPSPLALPLKAN